MEKKLTKKELKEIEERQEELRKDRRQVIDALKSYEADINATERYFRINTEEGKLDLYGRLTNEEKAKLLRRYECLNFLKPYNEYSKEEIDRGDDRVWTFVRLMMATEIEKDVYSFDRKKQLGNVIDPDGLWNDEIIWSTYQVKLYIQLAKKFGYTKIYYTNASTGALSNITDFVNLGAKVIGTCGKRNYSWRDDTYTVKNEGLIFDISDINIEEV